MSPQRTPYGRLEIIREDQLQATIEEMLDWARRLHFHDIDSRKNDRGFPDLPWLEPPIFHLWELKTEDGELRPEQIAWGEQLQLCTSIDYRVIRPRDLDWIREYLGF